MSNPQMYSVCAVDIVGFTRVPDDEQKTMNLLLNRFADEIIKNRNFIKLSTGDGLIISMWGCGPREALDFAKVLLSQIRLSVLRIPLRVGINVGTGYLIEDGASRNIVGNAVNLACRIMDIGDENHILLDSKSAELLRADGSVPQKFLHSLGSVTVKHGLNIDTISYFDEHFGNPTTPSKVAAYTGLKQLSLGRSIEILAFFDHCRNIDILTNAAPWFSHTEFLNQLERRVIEDNVSVRVILIDKACDYAKLRKRSPSYRTADELENTVTYTLSILSGFGARVFRSSNPNCGSFEVKVTQDPIYFAAYIHESEAMIGIYSPITTGSKGLYLTFKRIDGNSAYSWIGRSFDHYWRQAIPIISKETNDSMTLPS